MLTDILQKMHVLPSPILLIRTHERNIIKLNVQVFLKMNTWMFETFPPPMPPHVLFVDFVVLPPGHGRSVTNF